MTNLFFRGIIYKNKFKLNECQNNEKRKIMKKIFRNTVALLLIVSFALLSFSSCKNNKYPEAITGGDENNTEKVNTTTNISEYTIVRPYALKGDYIKYVKSFKDYIKTFTGIDLTIKNDFRNSSEPLDETAPEILIGETNRAATAAAKAELDNNKNKNAYIIKVEGNKIVILGKNDNATAHALKYFIINYVKPCEEGANSFSLNNGHSEIHVANTRATLMANFTQYQTITQSLIVNQNVTDAGVYEYESIIELQYNGDNNGTLLATYEHCGTARQEVKQSTDGGKTWEMLNGNIVDNLNTGYRTDMMPCLFELPADIGEYKAGTVIMGATSYNKQYDFTVSHITLFASTDCGKTWNAITNVASGGGPEKGVWEPFFIYDETTERIYCYYADDSDPVHSQTIAYRYSTDLINWSETKKAVACDDKSARPGMPSIAKMGNGEYFLTYEMHGGGFPDIQVLYKTTKDLDNWGDIAHPGTPILSSDKKGIGSAPWCSWSPAGGECGTLVVVGKHPVPFYFTDNGAPMYISHDYGKTFEAIPNPTPYQLFEGSICGYSACVFFSPSDPTMLYYVNNPMKIAGDTGSLQVAFKKIQFTGIFN